MVLPDPTAMEDPPPDPYPLFLPIEDPFLGISNYSSSPRHDPLPVPITGYSVNQKPMFTNGAGYTVSASRGLYSEGKGYAHGVVDAEMAVELAKQWTAKDQELATELTYTTFERISGANIPAAAIVGPDGGPNFIIPGMIGGRGTTFGDYYDEFWADDPFVQMTQAEVPVNDRGGTIVFSNLDGFNPPDMKIETIEVKLEITNATPESINELRIALRSPDGTVSDLSQFMLMPSNNVTVNNLDEGLRIDGIDSPYSGEEDSFVYTTSTNRHWGERTGDDLDLLPDGNLHDRQWELIIENYSGTDMTLRGYEVVFHGTPVQGERISGKVGVDFGVDGIGANDNQFDFNRSFALDLNGDGIIDDQDVGPDGYPIYVIDPLQEPFAGNVTVRARDDNGGASQGQIVAQFVTGDDGNFYFDLAPGHYTIEVVDPLGRTAKDGADFQSTWSVDINPLFSPLGRSAHYIDGSRIDNLNFLLGPGANRWKRPTSAASFSPTRTATESLTVVASVMPRPLGSACMPT